jgi:hypothetical protein
MTDLVLPVYYYPNKMGRIVLMAMEEILGRTGINAVLNLANLSRYINCYPHNNLDLQFDFSEMGKIQAALESMYGPLGGRGVALRSGRACFKYGLREFGPMIGITDLTFRLLPLSEKLSVGAAFFAEMFNRFSDQRVHVEETRERFLWRIERCPVCWGRHTDVTVCHLAVGLLQEALYWVSGGKFFIVEETHCVAMGDLTCTIAIDKQPVE